MICILFPRQATRGGDNSKIGKIWTGLSHDRHWCVSRQGSLKKRALSSCWQLTRASFCKLRYRHHRPPHKQKEYEFDSHTAVIFLNVSELKIHAKWRHYFSGLVIDLLQVTKQLSRSLMTKSCLHLMLTANSRAYYKANYLMLSVSANAAKNLRHKETSATFLLALNSPYTITVA